MKEILHSWVDPMEVNVLGNCVCERGGQPKHKKGINKRRKVNIDTYICPFQPNSYLFIYSPGDCLGPTKSNQKLRLKLT